MKNWLKLVMFAFVILSLFAGVPLFATRWLNDSGEGIQETFSKIGDEAQRSRQLEVNLEATVHRMKQKQAAVDAVIAGQLTLSQAADTFLSLHAGDIDASLPGATPEARARHSVLAWIRSTLAARGDEAEVLIKTIESEESRSPGII